MRYMVFLFALSFAAAPAMAQDADRSVEDGGVQVDGWTSRIDRRPLSRGMTTSDSRMAMEGEAFRLSIGPAGNFWNEANVASGDFEVKATFQEHAFQTGHPHPYGVFIGGSDLEADTEKLLYCIVYGNGTFSVKTFHGESVTSLVEKQHHSAIHVANAGQASNEIGWRVSGGTASCVVNGAELHSFAQSDVTGADKIDSTDGVFGIRVSHNLELTISGFGMTR